MSQYFNLTLDTTAPSSGSASGLQAYYKVAPTVTISASGASFMYVWVDQNATGTAPTSITWEPYAVSKTLTPANQGTNYFHAIFMDEVGNISSVVDSGSFVYDTVAPTVTAVSINNGDGYTRVTENTVRVSFSDATSGVEKITLGGDIAAAEAITYTLDAADRTAGYKDFTVTFTGAAQNGTDGNKTVTAVAIDFANNSSAQVSDVIVLDTTAADITPVLRKADDSVNLPAFVNYSSYGVRINTEDTDIVSYKVWEGNSEPTNWTAISNATEVAGVGYFVGSQTLSSGDGLKTIHVKVQDIAGNVTESEGLTVTLDTTAPNVTLTVSPSVISAQSGFDTATFSLTATDTNSAQGMTYEIKLGSTVIKSGTYDGNDIDITEAEMVAISAGQGTKSFTAEVTDIAGNTGTSTAQTVTVDLTAPTGTITTDAIYGTQTVTVTVAGSDTGGAVLDGMKVFLDAGMPATFENFSAGTYTFTNVAEGSHVAHLVLKDSVNNIMTAVDSTEFVVDITAPTATVSGPQYTNTASITVTINASDAKNDLAVSGLDKMKVWETGTVEPSVWEDFAASKSLTLTAVDGAYTVSVKLKDVAGNIGGAFVSNTINLDQDEPTGTITLWKSDDATTLPAHVNVGGFVAHIAPTDETAPTPVQYKLYGDFTGAMSEFVDYAPDAGVSYKAIAGTLDTTTDGTKTIYVVFKDAAGNTSSPVSASTIYDSAPPVITVATPDYSIISKQHTIRRSAVDASEISGKYNDMVTFTWSANEDLQAFKVCVNEVGQQAADAIAIGTTGGSQNMSGGSTAADTDITSIIMGADFAATSAVDDTDGVYEIIVYGKDLAGTWSAVHVLT